MESVITMIERAIDRTVCLKVHVDQFLFSFLRDDGTTEHHQSILWNCNKHDKELLIKSLIYIIQ